MTPDQLPSLPSFTTGSYARSKIAVLISEGLEKVARYGTGNAGGGALNELKVFFDACNTAIASFLEAVLPTVSTRVRTNSTTATITFSETLAASTSVPLSAFLITNAAASVTRVLSAVVVTGSTVVITGVGITATDIVTYTPPTGLDASKGIKDDAGNLAATFTGALA